MDARGDEPNGTVSLRAPAGRDWEACRMLLPEAFQLPGQPRCLMAVERDPARVLGAIAYRHGRDATYAVQLQVVRTHRRRGIGSALLGSVIAEARELGHRRVSGPLNTMEQETAAPFLRAHGFASLSRLVTAQVDGPAMLGKFGALSDRLSGRGVLPHHRLALLPDAPADEVARLYADHIANDPGLPVATIRSLLDRMLLNDSYVLMVGGRAEGMVLWRLDGEVGIVYALATTPRLRKSPGWAAVVLAAAAIRRGIALGGSRAEFDFADGNADMRKLVQRFGAKVIRIRDRYSLELDRASGDGERSHRRRTRTARPSPKPISPKVPGSGAAR